MDKKENNSIDEAIDTLLALGLIVCVGHNEKGEEVYCSKSEAEKRGLKPIPSKESGIVYQ